MDVQLQEPMLELYTFNAIRYTHSMNQGGNEASSSTGTQCFYIGNCTWTKKRDFLHSRTTGFRARTGLPHFHEDPEVRVKTLACIKWNNAACFQFLQSPISVKGEGIGDNPCEAVMVR